MTKIKSLVTAVGSVLTPLYIASLLITIVFRFLAHFWLKLTEPNYKGLLDLWEMFFVSDENSVNSSIANLFVNVKPTSINSGEEFRRILLEKTERVLSTKGNERLKCVIEKRLGLKFWKIHGSDVTDQFIAFTADNSEEVEDYLSKVANTPIRNKRLFEFHLGDQLVDGKYPLIFRIHHSVGDAYAVRQILVEAQISQSEFYNTAFADKSSGKTQRKGLMDQLILIVDLIKMLVYAPTACIERCFLEAPDENSLKTERVSGEKMLSWRTGELRKIAEIRSSTKKTFTELLFCALSKSLDDLFESRGESVPYVTTIFLTRKSQTSSGLSNEYLPVGFKLPVKTVRRDAAVVNGIRDLDEVPAFKCNYYLPRFAFLVYPMELPDWTYRCTELTGIFSNVPGPRKKVTFEEFEIEDFTFFAPNILRNNGLGVMVTSYVDKFICSVVIDRAVTRSDRDAQTIVDGIVNYIDNAHRDLQKWEFK